MNRIASIVLLIGILAPILVTLINVPIAMAQLEAVKIKNIYVAGRPISVVGGIYPGEYVVVEVEVGLAVPFYIVMYDPIFGREYIRQYVPSPTTGKMNITLLIPEQLEYLSADFNVGSFGQVRFKVEPAFGNIHEYPATIFVYPKIKVSPRVTTFVDENGVPKQVTLTIYGIPQGSGVRYIYIGTVCTLSIFKGPDRYGIYSVEVNLLERCGPFPRGSYPVTFELSYDDPSKHMNDTLEITPMVVFANREGHGMWTTYTLIEPDGTARPAKDNITLIGYGFPAGYNITNITLKNINFTQFNVHYNVTINMTIPSNGFFILRELPVNSNMTAGLYIPILNITDGVRIEILEFRNSYYLVRPVLLFLYDRKLYREYPSVLRPGDTIYIAAFGYGPGRNWTINVPNVLTAYFDNVEVTTVEIEDHGNNTFRYMIPLDATYGSHYIRGIDHPWKYEYSIAVVIGARAIFVVVEPVKMTDKGVQIAFPSYNDKLIKICPCEDLTGSSYCGVCVRYAGECDYLGDYINITIYGLTPGERLLEIKLGDYTVPKDLWTPTDPVADAVGKLTVSILVPTIIEGNYTVIVRAELQGVIVVSWAKDPSITYVTIVPKLLLLPLYSDQYTPVLVGSGVVRVLGVGFRPGAVFYKVLVNDTDAIVPLTTQVGSWRVNEKGVVVGEKIGDIIVTPALWIPFIEPGKYAIRITYFVGDTLRISSAGYVFVVNNLTQVTTKQDLVGLGGVVASAIKPDLDKIYNAVVSVDGKVAKIDNVLASLGDIQTKLQQLSDIVNRLDIIRQDLANTATSITNAANKIDQVGTKVDGLSAKIDDVSTSINTVSSKVDNVSGKVDGMATGAYIGMLAVVFALLATIFSLLAYMTIKKSVAPK